MPFYYLHDTNITPKSVNDFKYLYFNKYDFKHQTTISFDEEPDTKYCPHKMTGDFIQWNSDDEKIDIIGHENVIVASFEKVCNFKTFKTFELWVNSKYNKCLNCGKWTSPEDMEEESDGYCKKCC